MQAAACLQWHWHVSKQARVETRNAQHLNRNLLFYLGVFWMYIVVFNSNGDISVEQNIV